MPILLSRREIEELTDIRTLPGLALRTAYAAALRPLELLNASLTDAKLRLLDPTTAAALGALAVTSPNLFRDSGPQVQGHLDQSSAARRYRECGRRLTPMALRHACATHLLGNGMDLFALHAFLKHENLGCTRQYASLAVTLRGSEYARCHPLMANQRPLPHWRSRDLPDFGDEERPDEEVSSVATPTPEEVLQIIECAGNLRDRAMLRAFYATGLRLNELLSLVWADVTDEEQRLFSRSGKRDKDRLVLIDPVSLKLFREWGGKDGHVIGLKAVRAGEIFRHCANASGLRARYEEKGQTLSIHSLRHAFASHLYTNGMPMGTLKRLMGHDRMATTVIYLECSWERCLHQYQECHPL